MSTLDFSSRKGKPIVVVGSLNMDLVVRMPQIPRPGETLLGGVFKTFPGGKGANQAVAAARLVLLCQARFLFFLRRALPPAEEGI